jgi:hypothetical protein
MAVVSVSITPDPSLIARAAAVVVVVSVVVAVAEVVAVVASVATAADAVDVAVAVVVSVVTEDEAVAADVVLPEGEPECNSSNLNSADVVSVVPGPVASSSPEAPRSLLTKQPKPTKIGQTHRTGRYGESSSMSRVVSTAHILTSIQCPSTSLLLSPPSHPPSSLLVHMNPPRTSAVVYPVSVRYVILPTPGVPVCDVCMWPRTDIQGFTTDIRIYY